MKKIQHGDSYSHLYQVWRDMKSRCYNPNRSNYEIYGGRGIQVCPEWKIWLNFKKDLLQRGWIQGLWIDRIDPDGNYCLENIRVVTPQQSLYNRTSRTGKSTYKGVGWFNPTKKWRARVCKCGKVYNLGYFSTQEEAAHAYDEKALELFGEYAWINFKQEAS